MPFPPSGDLPDPRIEPGSLALQADSFLPEPPGKPHSCTAGSQILSLSLIELVNLPDSTLSMDSEKSLPFSLEFEGPVGI